jgi:murein tripeptide amidase MpaA
VPFTYEKMLELIEVWRKDPAVKVHLIGKSLDKRDLIRLEITDPNSPVPRKERWVHYFANQHPGETNSMWRMVGMIDWLLSEAGSDARRRFLCHFILMMSPDGIAAGWHRTNRQGIDMNRSYARWKPSLSALARKSKNPLPSPLASRLPAMRPNTADIRRNSNWSSGFTTNTVLGSPVSSGNENS